MKKRAKIIIAVVCAVLVAGGAVAYAFLPHPLNYPIGSIKSVGSSVVVSSKTDDSVTIYKEGGGEFKILMFTDMHLDGDNSTSYTTVSHLVDNITREKPDLVLLGGDNVTSALNSVRCRQLAKIFEKLGVYWAGILGNHEGDNTLSASREKMMKIFTSHEHCLMLTGPEDIDGCCNYALTITDPDGGHLHTFFCLDTHDRMSAELKEQYGLDPEERYYDGVHPNQVEWYSAKAAELVAAYPGCRSTVLIHIPLPQYEEAAQTGDFIYGGKLENVCDSEYDSGLFAAIKESATTQTVFCGHDHLNTFGALYDGVILSYIEPSGYGSYSAGSKLGYEEKDWLQGYTMLTVKADGTYAHKQVRNSAIPVEPSASE
ncbi:MAG: metallophosphoesterase, partial [Clostridia bacterium]|nr:metallophosphoesterase [Clostridia bacterium]